MDKKGSFKEEAHAFKEDSYRFESRSPSVSPGVAFGVAAVEGSRMEMYSRCPLEYRASGGGPNELVVCSMSGFGAGAFRRDGASSFVRQSAQAADYGRATPGGRSVRTFAQVPDLSSSEHCDR